MQGINPGDIGPRLLVQPEDALVNGVQLQPMVARCNLLTFVLQSYMQKRTNKQNRAHAAYWSSNHWALATW